MLIYLIDQNKIRGRINFLEKTFVKEIQLTDVEKTNLETLKNWIKYNN